MPGGISIDSRRRMPGGDSFAGKCTPASFCKVCSSDSVWKRRRSDRQGAVAAEALASKGVHLVPQLFIYGGADPLTGKCMPDYRAEGDRNAFDRRFMIVPEADHNFASMIWSGQVIEAVIAFVGEIGRMAEEGRRGNARIG